MNCRDDYFEKVVAGNVIHLLPEPEKAVHELERVVKRNCIKGNNCTTPSLKKNFCSLFDMSEFFSDHYFRKFFNFRFYGERSDFDFCPIFENWHKLVWGVGISPPSDLYS